jgi:hypothetical protein
MITSQRTTFMFWISDLPEALNLPTQARSSSITEKFGDFQ